MKKKALAILAALAVSTSMTACGSHSHMESDTWLADPAGHWKLCTECSEKTQVGDHSINDEWRCTVCNSEIFEWDDSVSVYTYDEHENLIRTADYDLDGNMTSELAYENQYDSNGCVIYAKEYSNGRLSAETEYTVIDGESQPTKYIYYAEDGTKFVNEYDSHGNVTVLIDYDAEGNESLRSESQYAENGYGEWYEAACTDFNSDGTKVERVYDEHGSVITYVHYEADGTISANQSWEYTYDEETGFTATEKAYVDGVLVSESIYKIVVTEDYSLGYPETVITYHEDGSYTVCVYNESDEILSETNYDAEGNIIG